jgi:hypothetical protein
MVGQVYEYDTLNPTSGELVAMSSFAEQPVPRRVATGAAAEIVGTVPAKIKLAPVDQAPTAEAPAAWADKSFFLNLDVKESATSGGLNFDIFIDAPQKTATSPVAVFSVFMDPTTPMSVPVPGAPGKRATHSAPHLMGTTIFVDVTQRVREALGQGASLGELTVRVVPSGPVPKGALTIRKRPGAAIIEAIFRLCRRDRSHASTR